MTEDVTLVFAGQRYPITSDTADGILRAIDSFDFNTHVANVHVSTTDGRDLLLRLGPSMPLVLERQSSE
ncbi:hypothetical protein SAMN04488550_4187 [Gordonia malaquae]|uniref:Uncharacterized protein n=1 Tax=Gordonia malaquae NBRC 108250 TaxID=1223542 RepID=M3TJI1_GORML|nr:hypothetical protein [Gordonia malaquae]GAC81661.1 hypothetical protein GM1_041_00320 [Gordonia malaquae NBRC 108250]SEE27207.1 hypothetical protein SAMN04488550_4187 [Gordonia malaquae]